MRSYTCIVDQREDGTWEAYFPALPGRPSIVAQSKRKARRAAFRLLVSYLNGYQQADKSLPKDTSTTYYFKVHINQLHEYPSLEREEGRSDLR